MRVQVFHADYAGCGHLRAIWPVESLAAEGFDVIARGDDDQLLGTWKEVQRAGDRVATRELVDLAPIDADVVVLQRAMHAHHLAAIPHIKKQGVAVVIELDDDFDNVHPQNKAWAACQPRFSPTSNHQILRQVVELADLVTVSTPALARKYPGSVVVPNYLPRAVFDLPPVDPWDGVRIGWSGDIGTHPTDLKVTCGEVGRACRTSGAKLHIVGNGEGVERDLGIAPSTTTGWVPLDRYFTEMGGMDIGIVPLQITPFNQAKSWLKGLEMAARRVPFVASPTEQYQALQRAGIGRTAAERSDWRRHLRALLSSPDMRAVEAEKAYEVALRGYVLEDNIDQWWTAWTTARDRASRKVSA